MNKKKVGKLFIKGSQNVVDYFLFLIRDESKIFEKTYEKQNSY